MRSVEPARQMQALAMLMVVLLGSGCAMLGSAPEAAPAAAEPPQAKAPAAVNAGPVAATKAAPPAAAASAAVPAAQGDTRPPVDPAAQRAFDDALRLLRAGRDAEAERAFKALASAHPTLGGAHANLALLHHRAGRDAEAVASLEQAVKLSPEQPRYLNALGVAYRHGGQFAKAREAYERAIALDAGYAAPQLNLAILLDLYLGDRVRAAEWYQRSAVLLPADAPQINKWLAELKARKPEASVASAASVAAHKEKP